MEIIKIIGIALLGLIIVILIKQYKPEFAIYISLLTGVLILFLSLDRLQEIIALLQSIANKASINTNHFKITRNNIKNITDIKEKQKGVYK